MAVDNVHGRLREARERNAMMRGNPFSEFNSGHIGDLGVTGLAAPTFVWVCTSPGWRARWQSMRCWIGWRTRPEHHPASSGWRFAPLPVEIHRSLMSYL